MTETVLGLLRHGQTDWNLDLRLQGVTDIPLNATGLGQAKLAAARIVPEDWDFVCSSPLLRAKLTAEIVAERLNISEVRIEELLLERSFGQAEGLTYEVWKAKHPSGIPPQGETLNDLRDRAYLLLERILNVYRGTRVLAVSHGALIRKLLRICSNNEYPLATDRLGNTSLNILVHDGDTWKLRSYRPEALGEH